MTIPSEIRAQHQQMAGRSAALEAAIAIAQMDPHSREDLRTYLSAMDEASACHDEDALRYLIEAIAEVFDPQREDQPPELEAWEREAIASPEGRRAFDAVAEEAERFLGRYHELKQKAGLATIRDVAEAAGLSATTVQAIESQRVKPQTRTLQKLADAFGVSVRELAAA